MQRHRTALAAALAISLPLAACGRVEMPVDGSVVDDRPRPDAAPVDAAVDAGQDVGSLDVAARDAIDDVGATDSATRDAVDAAAHDAADAAVRDAASDAGAPRPIAPHTSLYWQLEGTLDVTHAASVFDIDIFDAAPAGSHLVEPDGTTIAVPAGPNAGAVARLHALGRTVICYFDTGAYESYRPDAARFPSAVIGANTGWSGENWLDLRRASWPQFEGIINARMDLAVRMGCDGVEGDQNNPIGNSPGFAIPLADEAAWYAEVARQLHARGLLALMKNGVEVLQDSALGPPAVAAFDAALNEECNQYSECDAYDAFVRAGRVVWNVEYARMPTAFCSTDNAHDFDGYYSHNPPNGTTWTACR